MASISRFKLILRCIAESFLQEKAVPCIGAESCSNRYAFALSPSVEQAAPGDAAFTQMSGHVFAQTTTDLMTTCKIYNAAGLETEGAWNAAVSGLGGGIYTAPASVGIYADRGAAP